MAHERAISEALDSLWNKSSERNLIRGRLGLPGGGTPVFDVPDKPGYKYVNKGAAGELGQVLARDPIGVANTYNQTVWMRYEFGEYIIQRADSVAGGSGGGGGATNLDALTDVTLTTPANGNTLAYNSTTGQWVNVVPAGGAGGAPSPHAHSSVHHTGLLPWAELNKTGSSLNEIATRPHSMLTGIGANDHHAQAHVLATGTALGADHTISGAAAGEVLRASSATAAAFDVLQHTDLGNILPDQHHAQVHNITGTDHTISGSQFQVVGATAPNVLGLLTPTPAPGAAAAILRTDASGGIQLDTNLLYVDGANSWIGINRTPAGAALDVIAFSNADHTQRIKQKSGQTGRMWRIEDLSGNELIVLDSVGNLQSGRPGFVSGLTGWQITPQGNAEFNNIWARGELHATVFVKDEVHATGGSFLVATAGVLHDDAVISSSTVDDDTLVVYSTPAGAGVPLQVVTTSGTFTGTELHVSFIGNFININDPPSGPGFYFQPGDIIRSKTEVATGVTDFWLEVNNAVQNSGYSTYSVYKRSGTDGTLPKGSAVVSYGKEGDGRILLTSDLNYAPYIDVFTTGPNVWTGAAGSVIPRMRMGRLDGIGLPGVSGVTQYGMIAGKDLSDANSGYFIASNLGISLYKVPIRVNNGISDTGLWTPEGNLKLGSNIGTLATTSFEVVTQGANAGDVYIGDRTGTINPANPAYLYWNQQAGTLFIRGDLLVAGSPGAGYVTVADAHLWDSQVDTAAQGYAANAQTYSDARRIVGVNGSWDSPTSTSIRWGTKAAGGVALSAAMSNASTRTIADHASASILVSTRTYLYVNVSSPPTGTMTMGATTSLATVAASPNNVLIAVADPGDSSTKACSITVVAGSTYISGSNIFTGSIVAAQIAAGSITADRLHADTLTVTYLDPITANVTTAQNTANSASTAAGTAQSTANTANTAAGTAQTTANSASSAASGAQTTANTAVANAATAQTAADNAATAAAAAQAYGDQFKLQGIRGSIVVTGRNSIAWGATVPGGGTAISLFYADGNQPAIPDGSLTGLNLFARSYIYRNYSETSFRASTTLSGLSASSSLIAVFDPGATSTDPGSLSIVGGATYISGNNIVTGSINTANIKTDAITAAVIAGRTITADRMSVDHLDGLSSATVYTGTLEMDTLSNIHSAGKIAYGSVTPGVFLGYYSGAYRLDVGDANSALQWDGANLFLKTKQAISINNTASGQILTMNGPSGAGGLWTLNSSGVLVFTGTAGTVAGLNAPQMTANKFIQTGDTLYLTTPRVVTSAQTMPASLGFRGEMCWGIDGLGVVYLYLCYADNNWRRIPFPTTTW